MPKKKDKESEVKMCRFCGIEILGSFEHIKTKRGTEFYICQKCMAAAVNNNNR